MALVGPDGHLQGVLGVEKIHYHHESRNERDLRLVLEVVDIALTIWMVIDLVTIPAALIRVGLWVAEQVEIRSIKLAVNRAAKAALELAAEDVRWTRSELDVEKFWEAGKVTPTKQFSETEAKQLTDKIARRMKQLGIPEKNIGSKVKKFEPGKPKTITGISRDAEGFGDAFEPMGTKRGSNTRSFADQYQVEEGGISVQGSVFEPWKDFELWNNAAVDDRIDAIIAHEWMEFNGLSHWESVELIGQNLGISKKAKEILEFMKQMGKPRKAFTEFPK